MRNKLWEKLKEDERSFSWFHRKYLKDAKLRYNTLYQQAKGDTLIIMSDELKEAIESYTG